MKLDIKQGITHFSQRVYHGAQTPRPKRYVSRERLCLCLCLRDLTDYWVND